MANGFELAAILVRVQNFVRTLPMKIIVAVKQVPSRDSALRPDSSGVWLDRSDLAFEMNEPDAYALEEALQLKEKLNGEVVVLSAGPESVGSTIREALAKGADRAIHVNVEDSGHAPDPFSTARLLADAIAGEKPNFILTGLQSDDLGYGQTGVMLAEILGYSHATIVMDVEPKGSEVRVKRELEDGWYQYVTLPLPAVLTIQSGIRRLRYATLMGIKKAKTKEVKIVDAAGVDATAGRVETRNLQLPSRSKQIQMLTGDSRQIAQQLVEKLKFEARVL